MELRHASSPTLLRCLLLTSPALLLFAFFLIQLLLLDPASAWLRSATAPPESSRSICACEAAAAAPVAAAAPTRRSCAEDPEWRAAAALEAECALDRMLAERGASLAHSWSDEELFRRAGATVASYEDLLLLQEQQQQQRRDSAVVEVQGEGSRNNVTEEEEEGDATVSQFFLQYQQSLHKERCKLYYTNGGGGAYGRSTRLALAAAGGPDPGGGDLQATAEPPPILVRPKVAFLFLTTGWLPFARLWDAFFAGHEHLLTVYVHAWPPPGANRADVGGRVAAAGANTKHFWGRVVPGDAAERGDVSLIAAARRLLANALLDDPMNQHFALVSDHCVPVRGFRHVYGVLTAAGKSFVEQDTQSPVLWGRYVGRGGQDLMLPEIPYSQFRKGSQFWVLIRRHALLLIKDTKYFAKFAQRCVVPGTCYPEEHYFPTVLAIEDPGGTLNYTLTAVDWSRGQGTHPTSWTKDDLTLEFITRLQTDRGGLNLFARKFDDDTLDALLAFSHDLLRN